MLFIFNLPLSTVVGRISYGRYHVYSVNLLLYIRQNAYQVVEEMGQQLELTSYSACFLRIVLRVFCDQSVLEYYSQQIQPSCVVALVKQPRCKNSPRLGYLSLNNFPNRFLLYPILILCFIFLTFLQSCILEYYEKVTKAVT